MYIMPTLDIKKPDLSPKSDKSQVYFEYIFYRAFCFESPP